MSNDEAERREYEEWCRVRDEGPPPGWDADEFMTEADFEPDPMDDGHPQLVTVVVDAAGNKDEIEVR